MKIHYQKIEKRKPVVWDNWQTHEVHYFSLRAATADVRASRAKMMPHPTHANTFSGLSANSAKRGVGMAMPPKNGLMNLCIAISFRVGMCDPTVLAGLLRYNKYSMLALGSQEQAKKSLFLLFLPPQFVDFMIKKFSFPKSRIANLFFRPIPCAFLKCGLRPSQLEPDYSGVA